MSGFDEDFVPFLHFGVRLGQGGRGRWPPSTGREGKRGLWPHDLSVSHRRGYYTLLQRWETSFVKTILRKTRDVSVFREKSSVSHSSDPRHETLNGVNEGRPGLCASALRHTTGHRAGGSPRVCAGPGVCVPPLHGERACGEP